MMVGVQKMEEKIPAFISGISLLNVYIIKDNERSMAKCPELDLVTEMDTPDGALIAILVS